MNGSTTQFLYDGEDILKEYDGSGILQATYVHGPGIDEPIAMARSGQTFYYHADGLGSIIGITDSNEVIVHTYEYDSFGNITNQTGTVQNFYTYTGRELDSESGLYYYRARYYDAEIGRFTQKDPIGILGGINLYGFVRNNPLIFIDPFGYSAIGDFAAGAGSYFRGVYRTFWHSARALSLMGENEKRRTQLETVLLNEFAEQFFLKPDERKVAFKVAKNFACGNKARIAGRIVTGGTVTYLLTSTAGGYGFVLGWALNFSALNGDIVYGIESGLRTYEAIVRQGVGGEL